MEDNNVWGIVGLITTVGIAVVILIFLFALSGQTWEIVSPDVEDIGHFYVSGENLSLKNDTAVNLLHSRLRVGSLVLQNKSSAQVIGSNNYTVNYAFGTVTLNNSAWNQTEALASYQWDNATIRGKIRDSVVSGFEAGEKTADYMKLLVLAVVIGALLITILGVTAVFNGGKGKGGTAL